MRKKKKKKYEVNFMKAVQRKAKMKVLFKKLTKKNKKRKPTKF